MVLHRMLIQILFYAFVFLWSMQLYLYFIRRTTIPWVGCDQMTKNMVSFFFFLSMCISLLLFSKPLEFNYSSLFSKCSEYLHLYFHKTGKFHFTPLWLCEYIFILQVERTKLRPIASGVLTPFQGLSFLGFQLLLGLGILLQLNNYRCGCLHLCFSGHFTK